MKLLKFNSIKTHLIAVCAWLPLLGISPSALATMFGIDANQDFSWSDETNVLSTSEKLGDWRMSLKTTSLWMDDLNRRIEYHTYPLLNSHIEHNNSDYITNEGIGIINLLGLHYSSGNSSSPQIHSSDYFYYKFIDKSSFGKDWNRIASPDYPGKVATVPLPNTLLLCSLGMLLLLLYNGKQTVSTDTFQNSIARSNSDKEMTLRGIR